MGIGSLLTKIARASSKQEARSLASEARTAIRAMPRLSSEKKAEQIARVEERLTVRVNQINNTGKEAASQRVRTPEQRRAAANRNEASATEQRGSRGNVPTSATARQQARDLMDPTKEDAVRKLQAREALRTEMRSSSANRRTPVSLKPMPFSKGGYVRAGASVPGTQKTN